MLELCNNNSTGFLNFNIISSVTVVAAQITGGRREGVGGVATPPFLLLHNTQKAA